MKKNLNNFFRSYFNLLSVFLFCATGFIIAGCQSPNLNSPIKSALDQKFLLQHRLHSTKPSAAIAIYRNTFSQVLYSKCKWFPSDSRYAVIAQNKCGDLSGSIMAVGRFLSEENAGNLGYPVINNKDHIEYVDLPNNCLF